MFGISLSVCVWQISTEQNSYRNVCLYPFPFHVVGCLVPARFQTDIKLVCSGRIQLGINSTIDLHPINLAKNSRT